MSPYQKLQQSLRFHDTLIREASSLVWGVVQVLREMGGSSKEEVYVRSEREDQDGNLLELRFPMPPPEFHLPRFFVQKDDWLLLWIGFETLRIEIPLFLRPEPDGTWSLKMAEQGMPRRIVVTDDATIKISVTEEITDWADSFASPWEWRERGGRQAGFR